MPYDARAIANYFLDKGRDHEITLTALSLLKIMYFAHAWHLAKYKEPLIGQPFEAWKFGPVNRVVYEQIKQNKKNAIINRLTKFNVSEMEYMIVRYDICNDIEVFLDNIFVYYSKFNAYKLSDITHAPNTPWETVWKKAENSAVAGMWIPDELILEWFENSGGRLYLGKEQGANI